MKKYRFKKEEVKMRKRILFLILLLSFNLFVFSEDLHKFVNPFIGTGGHGHTYPGVSLPFGMIQVSPDTRVGTWDGCSGYHYSDNSIIGFTHTHLSGTGCSDYGDILLIPITGKVKLNPGTMKAPDSGYRSRFSHNNEYAHAGYYSVFLDDYGIKVELTATERAGFHKYIFPKNREPRILLDLKHRDKIIDSHVRIVNSNEIEGYRFSKAWAKKQYLFFVIRFSKAFESYEIYENDKIVSGKGRNGKNIKTVFNFNQDENRIVMVKIGISAVSIEGARKNLDYEIKGWNFDKTKKLAEQKWDNALSKIMVSTKDRDKKIVFYTALYHSLLNPNLYMDIDGKYRGRDLKIHKAENSIYYTLFSLWDTFRAEHPLFTIIERKRTLNFIKTFLLQYKQGGKLPVWELSANETDTMIGYHSIPVIVDAYVKGIMSFDTQLALEAMKKSALSDKRGLGYYKKYGFIPADMEAESVSKTLEYSYDDWCIAEFAKRIGAYKDYLYFLKRGQYYKNLFDSETGFFRPKVNGGWQSPFNPKEVNSNYTEANAWQYNFFVPQDITNHIKLLGGKEKYSEKLDKLFTESTELEGRKQADITGLIGQYAHGNEPSHHIAYLYVFGGKPWKTQNIVKQIGTELYKNSPDGLSGNEDCGQMSAWYVLSGMGFYPVTPGLSYFVIGTPFFDKTIINLENGKKFTIIAKNLSDKNYYIQSTLLNGGNYGKSYIDYKDILKGGEIVFYMGDTPNKNKGVFDKDIPKANISKNLITIVPYIKNPSKIFKDERIIDMDDFYKNSKIFYRIDKDKNYKVYEKPFKIHENTGMIFYAEHNGEKSRKIESKFYRVNHDWKIKIKNRYNNLYPAEGSMTLIDGITGGNDFRTGEWQGYWKVNLDAIIDFRKEKKINSISIGFLQDIKAWIFMPLYVDFYISKDGKKFIKLGRVLNDTDEKKEGSIIKYFTLSNINNKGRYLRIFAKNREKCPLWHVGSGERSWIFSDEIIVK
jgi:predicted alpha-1,2-mannosidase